MAYEILRNSNTLIAAADLSAKQYFFVKTDTTGKAALAGAGDNADGVLQNKPTSGQSATISGSASITKITAGGSVTAGDAIASDASGKGVTASSGNYILGKALTSASSGNVFSMLQNPGGKL